MASETTNEILLSRSDLKRHGIRVSNTTLLRWEAHGRFPRRVKLGGTTVAWFLTEIEQWLEERSEERSRTHYAEY